MDPLKNPIKPEQTHSHHKPSERWFISIFPLVGFKGEFQIFTGLSFDDVFLLAHFSVFPKDQLNFHVVFVA